MKLSPMKPYTRIGKLRKSPLGYDGTLPATKRSAWSKDPARVTAIGARDGDERLRAEPIVQHPVTAPKRVVWTGLRLKNNRAPLWDVDQKILFAGKKVPRSWKLPGFDSTW